MLIACLQNKKYIKKYGNWLIDNNFSFNDDLSIIPGIGYGSNNDLPFTDLNDDNIYNYNRQLNGSFWNKNMNINYRIFDGEIEYSYYVNSNTVGADPYINPIYGKKYKLPDKGNIYRYIDNNDLINRFLINIQCWSLPQALKLDINNYIFKELKLRYNIKNNNDVEKWMVNNNIQIPKNAIFIRYLYINNNNNTLIFDFEKFCFITKSGSENRLIPNNFKILYNKHFKSNLNIELYDQIRPSKQIRIITQNKTYGKILIDLFKYNNPQIRNALNIETYNDINKYNSRGALLGNQNIFNITLNKIDSKKKIAEFIIKNSKNILKEYFIDEYGKSKWENFKF